MKIIDVAEHYAEAGGGVRTYVDHKLRAGAALGHEVVIVAPAAENREEKRNGGRILWVESPPMPGDPRYHVFVKQKPVHDLLEREKPDVVEGSSVYAGGWFAGGYTGSAIKSLIFHQDPVAVYGHSFLDRYLKSGRIDRLAKPIWAYLRRLAERFDTTVVAGDWLRERLTSFGLPRVSAVPFGIDAEPFVASQRDEKLRRRLLLQAGLSSEAALLVAVSRHHPEKRLPTLIEAVQIVSRARPVGLVIFGDGPSRRRIETLASRAAGVAIAGYTRDRKVLAQAVASADGFLHGSAAETYGLVVAEAVCAGTPLVVPDTGGAADLARPEFAETYRAGDPEACAAAIRRLLSRDPNTLRAACLSAAKKPRTLDAHFAELFEHYRQLVERLNGRAAEHPIESALAS